MSTVKLWLGSGIVCALLFAPALNASEQAAKKSGAPAPAKQRTFDTPKEAADALIAAAAVNDVPALKAIVGPDGEDLVATDDPVQDKNRAEEFTAKAREKTAVVPDAKNPNLAVLSVGGEDWPMPIPIVRNKSGKWFFDSKAGRKEVLYRRIGQNELDAIQVCRGYVEAQHEYAFEKHDGSSLNQYAQKIISTPGKQDGLAWRNPDGTSGGPIGEPIDRAIAEGYTQKTDPYHGYYFKILKGQGPHADGGAYSYVVRGRMIGGFALVAYPAQYGNSGIMTFVVNYDGVVHSKDLGPNTVKIALAMTKYDPDQTWKAEEDASPNASQ
jgi:hypothetical protein